MKFVLRTVQWIGDCVFNVVVPASYNHLTCHQQRCWGCGQPMSKYGMLTRLHMHTNNTQEGHCGHKQVKKKKKGFVAQQKYLVN